MKKTFDLKKQADVDAFSRRWFGYLRQVAHASQVNVHKMMYTGDIEGLIDMYVGDDNRIYYGPSFETTQVEPEQYDKALIILRNVARRVVHDYYITLAHGEGHEGDICIVQTDGLEHKHHYPIVFTGEFFTSMQEEVARSYMSVLLTAYDEDCLRLAKRKMGGWVDIDAWPVRIYDVDAKPKRTMSRAAFDWSSIGLYRRPGSFT